jgi:hypothetical protein
MAGGGMEACAQPTPTTCTVFALAGIGVLTTTSWSGNSSRRQRSEWVAAEMEMKGLGKRISGCIPFVPLARGHGWARGRAQEDAWTVWPDASAAQIWEMDGSISTSRFVCRRGPFRTTHDKMGRPTGDVLSGTRSRAPHIFCMCVQSVCAIFTEGRES